MFPGADLGNGPVQVTFEANGDPREFIWPDDLFNWAPFNYLQIPLTRYSGGFFLNYDVADRAEMYVEASYARNEARQGRVRRRYRGMIAERVILQAVTATDNNKKIGESMAESTRTTSLTGQEEFDGLIAEMASLGEPEEIEAVRARIWERFGTEGAVLISDMASFSSMSRKIGVCHYLKMIHRARNVIAPIIARNNGALLKCDADNCYAYFENVDDAIQSSFDINTAVFEANVTMGIEDQIYLSIGIDYGRVLLIGDLDFFGDPVNTASKLGEDLAIKAETLVTQRALRQSGFELPASAEHMVARISEIKISYVRIPMLEKSKSA